MPKRRIYSESEIRQRLCRAIEAAGGVRQLARTSGVNGSTISLARKEDGALTPAILEMLGVEEKREKRYVEVRP